MIEEGRCIYPMPNKKPCGRPCPILNADGETMLFCAEHTKAVDEWIKRHKAKATNGRKGHFKAGKVVMNV